MTMKCSSSVAAVAASPSVLDPARWSINALRRHQSGVAMVEFAIALPFIVGISMGGIEIANMAYSAQLVSDIAVQTADSVSRVRTSLSEQDVTDIMRGMNPIGDRIGFAQNGRIIVSSLVPVLNSNKIITNQKINWQRCYGALRVNSSYGAENALLGLQGMGPDGGKIKATANTAVIVVEVQYEYQPIITNAFFGRRTLSSISAMMVRERENHEIGEADTKSLCSKYSA